MGLLEIINRCQLRIGTDQPRLFQAKCKYLYTLYRQAEKNNEKGIIEYNIKTPMIR